MTNTRLAILERALIDVLDIAETTLDETRIGHIVHELGIQPCCWVGDPDLTDSTTKELGGVHRVKFIEYMLGQWADIILSGGLGLNTAHNITRVWAGKIGIGPEAMK